jgi:succinate dehydrogenase / fumarate reductase cytochrome b subunit
MATPERPLSPHLQVYRPQITTVLSILHRITGVFLAFGAFALALLMLEVSRDPSRPLSHNIFSHASHALNYVFNSLIGPILAVAFIWSLVFHLLNGIRHLFWDAGKGFEIKQFTMSGWLVVVLSLLLTFLLVLVPVLGSPL